MTDLITVVIPYYQRQAGLLVRALKSVMQQTAFEHIEQIIVVDDGSPIDAQSEVAQLDEFPKLKQKLLVVQQSNGGVASARNAGIEKVKRSSRYVAFLDADDEWLPEHLALALPALQGGSDFHFCNFTHIGQTVGAFERAGYIDPSEHLPAEGEHNFQYKGDIVKQITTANVIGASSVFYDKHKHPDKRFKTDFTFAGEDYLMWLDIAQDSDKITFTSKITTHCGEGINLFSGAKWGSAHLSKRLFDEINYRYYLLNHLTMTKENRERVKEMLSDNRQAYIGNCQSMLKRLKLSAIVLFFKHFLGNKPFRDVLFKRCD
ncbi:glycosyltransferase family 2 protein [Aliiglaciecola litoralis]|uniref:Glycosyltransferase family 2 protein n=1 Tax=Aliiglaciecola litoralis TaxID=582857 RepID=A0ABP3WZ35_9ALTE